MARSKQTARKNTGGQQPSRRLATNQDHVFKPPHDFRRVRHRDVAYKVGAEEVGRTIKWSKPLYCSGWTLPQSPARLVVRNKPGDAFQLLNSDFTAQLASIPTEDGRNSWKFKDIVTDLDPRRLGILDEVERILSPDECLQARIDELWIQGVGHITKPEKYDDDELLAILVVVLPTAYTGGEVILTVTYTEQQEVVQLKDTSRLKWICFSSGDCTYDVKEVTSGVRVAVTFKLFAKTLYTDTNMDTAVDLLPSKLEKVLRTKLEDENFFKDGGELVFPCQHMYPKVMDTFVITETEDDHVKGIEFEEDFVPRLKGSDAEVYHAAKNIELEVHIGFMWNGGYFTNEFHGLKIIQNVFDCHQEFEDYPERKFESCDPIFCHDNTYWMDGVGAFVQGNEEVKFLKRAMVVKVSIPSWEGRRHLRAPVPEVPEAPVQKGYRVEDADSSHSSSKFG